MMARRTSITREQILEAARQEFMEEGLGATTAAIADRAGISEGSIFRRWSTKQDLFMDAMGLPQEPVWMETVEEVCGRGDLRENLVRIADEIIDFFLDLIPKTSMVMACGPRIEDESLMREGPARGVRHLMKFFEREKRQGRLRSPDPEITARMFLGALHHYSFAEICGLNDMLPMPRRTYVRGVVTHLLEGLEVAGDEGEEA
jgi:AcrR family transcriptional regulator